MAMHYADVILAVGARFDDRVIGNPGHLAKSRAASSTSTSILRPFPSASASMCPSSECPRRHRRNPQTDGWRFQGRSGVADWWKQIEEWRGRDCLRYKRDKLIMPTT